MIMPVLFLFVKQNRNYNSYITTAGGRTMLLFDTQQIGNRLLAIRKQLGLTQSEAAELCGLSGRAYADIERGEVNMRIQTVQRICRAFHITPDKILTAENEPLAADQDALFARLQGCRPKEKETALALLATYLQSLEPD
jgi:transcriptional regulator with XRE-family HTH domain